ncbi:MAG: glycosyltransferase family 39 protein [Thermoflexales bacterium]|nr:glycosyltransferase family 39 protein [Thermoflexales bacterium]
MKRAPPPLLHSTLVVLLLLAFWLQAAGNLSEQSPVVDEPAHIARAQAYWRTGDFRLQRGHPPLIHALSGLFLQLEPGLPSPADLPGWAETDRMSVARHLLWDENRPAERIVFLARLPVLMLALCMCAVLFRWANRRLGKWPALGALCLCTFDPNLLAHGVLITTDMVVTVFILLAAYALDRWMAKPDWQRALAVGASLGLALASKFSAIILLPIIVLAAGWLAWSKGAWERRRAWPSVLGALVIMAISAALVLSLVYRFETGPLKIESTRLSLSLDWSLIPSFWRGLLAVDDHNEAGHLSFLLGQISPRGWWYYFIVALVLKTPLPTLILLAWGIGYWILESGKRGLGTKNWRPETRDHTPSIAPVWILLPALYFLASLRASINVGYRHILPIVPFVVMIGAGQVRAFRFQVSSFTFYIIPSLPRDVLRFMSSRACRGTFYALLAWLSIGAILIYPYHLAYFNELVGGPDGGYRALVDSNLDWGQDVKRLKRYLDANDIREPYLAIFAGSLPEYYGIQSRPLPGPYQAPTEYDFHRIQPAPGVYVIGASNLQGLRLDDPDTFDTFRRQQPVARVGHTLFVYRVEERPQLEKWVAVCHTVDGPMDGEDVEQAFGRGDLRKVFYDCQHGWIYPGGGASPGWYVVPSRDGRASQAAPFLLETAEVFRERGYRGEQEAYSVHRLDSLQALKARLAMLSRPPGAARAGPASLLGYMLDSSTVQAGQKARMVTYWRVEDAGQPLLSILAHLGKPDNLVATGDGLAVPAETWQVGDIIAQVHTFEIPPHTPAGEYTIHLGLYSIVSGQREPASLDNQPIADGRVPVATLHVVE